MLLCSLVSQRAVRLILAAHSFVVPHNPILNRFLVQNDLGAKLQRTQQAFSRQPL